MLFVVLFFATERLCHIATDGFCVLNILKQHTDYPLKTPSKDIKVILSQKFSYLGKGAQCYAFLSADERFVLKFFRNKRLKTNTERSHRYLHSWELAENDLREETAIVYAHLDPSSVGMLTLVDKLGIEHQFDTENTPFLIQKRADPFYAILDTQNIHTTIEQLTRLIKKRCALGIRDKDPNLATNFGFVEGKLIQIDTSRFYEDVNIQQKEEIEKITAPLKQWLYSK